MKQRHHSPRGLTWLLAGFVAVLALIAGVFAAPRAVAASVAPVFMPGNPSCSELGYAFGFKPSGPGGESDPTGTWTVTYTAFGETHSFTITVTENASQDGVDWTSQFPIDAVIVKGGPNANVYLYAPPSNGDRDLVTPTNENNDTPYGLSHVDFCFGNDPNADVTVEKTAQASYTERHSWSISKSASPRGIDMFTGDSADATYTVGVIETVSEDSFLVTGSITITNNGFLNATISSVSDLLSDATAGTVTCPSATPFVLAPFSSVTCTYTASPSGRTATLNTATVAFTDVNPDADAPQTGSATFTWSKTLAGPDEVNVDDTNGSSWLFTGTGSVTYTRTFTCDADEGTHSNTATIRETGATSTATVGVNCYALSVTKTASTSFDRDWDWTITKSGDQTALTLSPGQEFLVNYTVQVSATNTDSNWTATGTITVNNPAPISASILSVSDLIGGFGPASVDCGVTFPYSLAAGGTLNCTYGAALPDGTVRTNTATATLQNTPSGTTDFSGSAVISFVAPTNETDECITVEDDQFGTLGTVCAGDAPKTYTYSTSVGPYETCGVYEFDNTATFTTNDSGTTGSSTWTVTVTVPCGSCTLTPGYWKTHSQVGPAPYDDTWALLGAGQENTSFFYSGKSYYQVLWTAPQGNAYYILAHAWIAAKLNTLNGATMPSAVQTAFNAAQTWFGNPANTPASAALLKGNARNQLITWAGILDAYNNGITGPGHCSE